MTVCSTSSVNYLTTDKKQSFLLLHTLLAAALNLKWHLINASKGRITDPVRFGALLIALGYELEKRSAANVTGGLERDDYGYMGGVDDTNNTHTRTTNTMTAYTDIASQLFDVLVTQLQNTLSHDFENSNNHTHSTESHSAQSSS